jgi:fumarate hydratase class II
MSEYRIETDAMGDVRVPRDALWGAQTQRAVENFPISGLRFPRSFIAALGLIKRAAAEANRELGLLDPDVARAVIAAADEVIDGRLDAHFVVDIFQTGSGTSTNMNANEVIANRARQMHGDAAMTRSIHPNDHVNLGQSSNDVVPTAMQVAASMTIGENLVPAFLRLRDALRRKAHELDHIVKPGRTHLMDAVPVRLGQEFAGYAAQIEMALERLDSARYDLAELPLGGTAVGTGINTHEDFARLAIAWLAQHTGIAFREARNHFERQGTRDVVVFAHGSLVAAAVGLARIAHDLRLLASGPRGGLAEITLPALQPGSSIMPGKVNPVIPEAVIMVSAQVMGNHTTITVAGTGSVLELNVMMPVMAHALLQSIALLASAARLLADRCVAGITADEARCRDLLEADLALATALVPRLGHDLAAQIAMEAFRERKALRDIVRTKAGLSEAEIDDILDARRMTEPGIPGGRRVPGGAS